MSYTCRLMVLRECECTNLISKANFNLINKTDLFICLHIMFRISFQISKGQKSYRKFLGVRSELLLSILKHCNKKTALDYWMDKTLSQACSASLSKKTFIIHQTGVLLYLSA